MGDEEQARRISVMHAINKKIAVDQSLHKNTV